MRKSFKHKILLELCFCFIGKSFMSKNLREIPLFEKAFPGPWCRPSYVCWTSNSGRVPGEYSLLFAVRRAWWSPAPQVSYHQVLGICYFVDGRDKHSRCSNRCTPSIIWSMPIPTRYDVSTLFVEDILLFSNFFIRSSFERMIL